MLNNLEKKQMKIFLILLAITTSISGLTLKVAYNLKLDTILNSLVLVQMLMPALCVVVAEILTEKKEDILFKFNITYIILTISSYIFLLFGIFIKSKEIGIIFNVVIVIFNIILFIFYLVESKEKKAKRKYLFVNRKESYLFVLLFIFLYFLRMVIALLIDKQSVLQFFQNMNYRLLLILLPSYFLSLIAFFGEEFGWRYFLQPKLQKIFGKKLGVLILGTIWGFWHIFISMYYYSPETFLQQVVTQVAFCIIFGIFIGLSYMVTENIWVPVIIHYLNNNLGAVITGTDFSNQIISWKEVFLGTILNVFIFGIFIFSKHYKENKDF